MSSCIRLNRAGDAHTQTQDCRRHGSGALGGVCVSGGHPGLVPEPPRGIGKSRRLRETRGTPPQHLLTLQGAGRVCQGESLVTGSQGQNCLGPWSLKEASYVLSPWRNEPISGAKSGSSAGGPAAGLAVTLTLTHPPACPAAFSRL